MYQCWLCIHTELLLVTLLLMLHKNMPDSNATSFALVPIYHVQMSWLVSPVCR